MRLLTRAWTGALAGAAATVVLSGLRQSFRALGIVFETAPMQVVDRAEEVGLVQGLSPAGRNALSLAAHFAYGTATGAAMGILRREPPGDALEEAAVGSALGILSWGLGWSTWLPLAGVHRPPWRQRSPKVLLPVVDHAAFGATWGIVRQALLLRRRAGAGTR
jgi:hypothetical protein